MTQPALDTLERTRMKIVLATIAINILAVVIFSRLPWSDWRTGLWLNLVDNLLLIMFAVRYRDPLIAHFMVFGLALGFTELAADAWLVDVTRTLDYSIGGGPMIWRSPLWMPFAWEIIAVQFGYVGLRLWEKWGKKGLLLAGLIGAVNIPFYEEMALQTKWWEYHNCRMFLHTPYYIIVGEFLIVLCIAAMAVKLRKKNWVKTIFCGFSAGLSIFACYALAYFTAEMFLKNQSYAF